MFRKSIGTRYLVSTSYPGEEPGYEVDLVSNSDPCTSLISKKKIKINICKLERGISLFYRLCHLFFRRLTLTFTITRKGDARTFLW